MFFELFYPKKLRTVVKNARKEGILNEVAIQNINKMIKKSVILGVIVFVMFISKPLIALALFMVSAFSIRIDFYVINLWRRVYEPYYCGESVKVKVKHVRRYALLSGKIKLECEDLKTSEMVVIGPLYGMVWEKEINLREGDIVSVWCSKTDRKYAMPDINYLKLNYSLTTSIL